MSSFAFTLGAINPMGVMGADHQEFLRQNIAGMSVFARTVHVFEQVHDSAWAGVLTKNSKRLFHLADLCDFLSTNDDSRVRLEE